MWSFAARSPRSQRYASARSSSAVRSGVRPIRRRKSAKPSSFMASTLLGKAQRFPERELKGRSRARPPLWGVDARWGAQARGAEVGDAFEARLQDREVEQDEPLVTRFDPGHE